MAKKKETEIKVLTDPIDQDVIIVGVDGVYIPVPYDEKNAEYDEKYAYVINDLFYPYRGKVKKSKHAAAPLPGIYRDDMNFPVIVEPTESEKPDYDLKSHLENLHPENIIRVLSDNKNIYYSYPESSKLFVPDINESDDILKRAIKLALKAKNIDLDSCKNRFTDKNALFNFKQVVKSPSSRLSILLFERGCEALGIKYSIILEEANPDELIGTSLNDPEAKKNIIRNLNGIAPSDAVDINNMPDKVRDNFRDDSINLTGKIIVASDDSYAI